MVFKKLSQCLLVFGWALIGAFGAASPGLAANCEAGTNVTITAKVANAFANKGGKTTVNIISMSPCATMVVLLNTPRPPASCRYGMMLTATGTVKDDFLGPVFTGDTFSCQ